MKTPLERAARAAAEYHGERWEKLPEKSPIENSRALFRETARVVLQAIREPSEEMIDAAQVTHEYCDAGWTPDDVKAAWQAMIEAALNEAPQ